MSKKVTELTEATESYADDIVMIVQNEESKQIPLSGIISSNQSTIELTETITADTEYTLPLYYQVGNNSLELYYCGEKLIKDVHYSEVGTSGNTSNIITFISDLEYIDMSDIDEFEDFTATLDVIVRGNYE